MKELNIAYYISAALVWTVFLSVAYLMIVDFKIGGIIPLFISALGCYSSIKQGL